MRRVQVVYSPENAANRFGLGARPGDLKTIGSNGPDWLMNQLSPQHTSEISDEGLKTSKENALETFELLKEVRQGSASKDEKRKRKSGRERNSGDIMDRFSAYRLEVEARTRHSLTTASPFRERLVHFWSNHFTVSVTKPQVANIAGSYEREAIRPHVTGRFADMLMAVAKHPAMLLYLDNVRSAGPNSLAGKRRNMGLNENLAREILELHTLGVKAGYSQDDVTTFALAITGWMVPMRGRFGGDPGSFHFQKFMHEPGRKTILGKPYADGGLEQGEAILRDLAVHPATANFIATKLARHFISDDPPQPVIDRLSAQFLDTGGDLKAVSEALVTSPEAWTAPQAKFKSPNDFFISACAPSELTALAVKTYCQAIRCWVKGHSPPHRLRVGRIVRRIGRAPMPSRSVLSGRRLCRNGCPSYKTQVPLRTPPLAPRCPMPQRPQSHKRPAALKDWFCFS